MLAVLPAEFVVVAGSGVGGLQAVGMVHQIGAQCSAVVAGRSGQSRSDTFAGRESIA